MAICCWFTEWEMYVCRGFHIELLRWRSYMLLLSCFMRMIQTVWVSLSCRNFLGSISTVIEASCPLIQFERERFMIECILRGLGISCGSSIYIRHIFATTPIHVRLKETTRGTKKSQAHLCRHPNTCEA